MRITKGTPEQYPEVRGFYHSLIDALEGAPYHPMWQKDVYPAPEALREALGEDSLFLGWDGQRIAAAMVLTQAGSQAYLTAAWPTELGPEEFLVIHMLGVHSDFAGRGCAREMVRYAIDYAGAAGLKAVRLDVLKGNLPAERLYESLGFLWADTASLFYEDTGWAEFLLYEYRLDGASPEG